MRLRNKGFTLVEVLLVISIVGLLATFSAVAFKNIREAARDSRRVSDLKAIQKALELYYSENGEYPMAYIYGGYMPVPEEGCTGGFDCSHVEQELSWQEPKNDGTFMEFLSEAGLMAEVPVDPINDANHHYKYYFYYDNGGVTQGCQRPFYVLVAWGMETDGFINDDGYCWDTWEGMDNVYRLVGGQE